MPRSGSGAYSLPEAAFVYGTLIDQDAVNSNFTDIATALTNSLAKNGETNPTANLPMATFRHTGVGAAASLTDYARADQVQNSAFIWCGTAGGTANALTATPSPAIGAYAAGQKFTLMTGAATNTSTVTLAVSGLPAKAVNVAGSACRPGTFRPSTIYDFRYNGSEFDLIGETVPVILDPFRFGAKEGGSLDAVGYINDALSYIRENVLSITASAYFLDCKGAHLKIDANSIAANAIVEGRMWGIRNAVFDGYCDALPVIDLCGSRDAFLSNVQIYGRAANAPSSGIFLARADAGTNAAGKSYGQVLNNHFHHVRARGYFLDASLHVRSCEESHFVSCEFQNQRTGDGSGESWAAIFDGNGNKTTSGDSENETPYSGGRSSFTMNQFDRCSFEKPDGTAGPTVYITDMASAQFDKPYITNGSGAAIYWEVNDSFNPYAMHFDGLQIETTGNDYAFEFDGVSGNPVCVINDLRISTGNIFSEDAFIKLSNFGTGSLTINGMPLSVGQWNGGTKPTAVVSRGSNEFNVTGADWSLPALTDFDPTTGATSFKGWYNGRATGVKRHYGGLDNRTGGVFDAYGHYKSGATASIADNATQTIDLTADGINQDGIFLLGSTANNVAALVDFYANATARGTILSAGSSIHATLVKNTDLSAASLPLNAGKLTIAINEDEIQLLNELGFTINCNWFIMARGA